MTSPADDADDPSAGLRARIEKLAIRAKQGLPARATALRLAARGLERPTSAAREEIRRLAHRLHGTAGSYGMAALGRLAEQAEVLASNAEAVAELGPAALRLADACDACSAPLDSAPRAAKDATKQPTDSSLTAMTTSLLTDRVRALVVDDDPAIGRLVGLLLERMGDYEVEVKSSPADALAWLDGGEKPALLVVDAMMPEMNGRDLARAVRSRAGFDQLPVAVLSAATARELGWDDFAPDAWITKPVRAAELLSALKKLR